MSKKMDRNDLHDHLISSFSIEELDSLAYRLGAEPEEIPGKTVSAKARNLISFAQRRKLLPQLFSLVSRERPLAINQSGDDSISSNILWDQRDSQLLVEYFKRCADYEEMFIPLSELDEIKVKEFLIASGLARQSLSNAIHLTKAGVLFCCKKSSFPRSEFFSHVHYTEHFGAGEQREVFWGPTLLLYKELYSKLETHFSKKMTTTRFRNDYGGEGIIYEYPRLAIIEALVNFLIHRDYSVDDIGRIDVYPDRIEFSNPGQSTISPRDLLRVTKPIRPRYQRNQRLIEALNMARLSQREGSGILTIKNELERYRFSPNAPLGLSIKNDSIDDRFVLIIYKNTLLLNSSIETNEINPHLLREIRNDATHPYREKFVRQLRQSIPQSSRTNLIGVNHLIQDVTEELISLEKANPVLIYGIGGIGKTCIAEAVASQLIEQLSFSKVVWITIKNEDLKPAQLTLDYLVDKLIQEIGRDQLSSSDKRQQQLSHILNLTDHLIIIDNNECPIDREVIRQFSQWSGASRFLITSRHKVPSGSGWMTVQVNQLSLSDAAELIRTQAQIDGVVPLKEISELEITPIYDLVGGNPLAIKLIVGLSATRPLQSIIDDILIAKSKKIESLYTHIFWTAWQSISENGQSLLQTMFLADEMGFDTRDMEDFSRLTGGELWDAADELIERSLMERRQGRNGAIYSIHRLTASFLQTEIIKWPDLPDV